MFRQRLTDITPTVSDVTKRIVKTGGMLAVTTAISILLESVDWVLDPANNSVRWKEKPPAIDSTGSTTANPTGCSISVEQEIWRGDLATISQRFLNRLGGQLKVTYLGDNKYNIGVTNGNYYWKRIAVCNPLPPLKTGEIPYDTVAQKIIDMANADVSAGDEAGLKQKAMAEAYVGDVADEIATLSWKESAWEYSKTKFPAIPDIDASDRINCMPKIEPIYNKIYTISNISELKGLEQRYYDLLLDKHNLYYDYRPTTKPHPLYGSWDGHIKKFTDGQIELKNLIDKASPWCTKYVPSEAYDWVTKKVPEKPDMATANAAGWKVDYF